MNASSSAGTVTLRLLRTHDVPELHRYWVANRAAFAPFDPVRSEDFFTLDGQRRFVAQLLREYEAGTRWPGVIEVDGALRGHLNVQHIVRFAFQSASLGYAVDASLHRRGVATEAVRQVVERAFRDIADGGLGLHRLEACTLTDNVASQRVLQRNGFVQYGLAPRYLHIGGDWRDHVLFQLLNE